MLQARRLTHMKGGKYNPPNRKRLAADMVVGQAEGRETYGLKDVLIRLARQKTSGSIDQ
jgi:hypothetical protein